MRLLLAFVLLWPGLVWAQSNPQAAPKYVERVGAYEVRFSAVPTADLPAVIARRYDLSRSAAEVLVNIHVRRMDTGEALGQAVKAEISASVRSLIGQQRELALREIDEGETVYYIASHRGADDNDRWIYQLEIRPADGGRAFSARFERQFR
jgi:hypothetical protein